MFEINSIIQSLVELNEKEMHKLFRLRRRAIRHRCSDRLVEDLYNEAWFLYQYGRDNPGRVMDKHINFEFKYAFKI